MDKHNKNKRTNKPALPTGDVFQITGDWYVQCQTLREKFPQLTDADLKFQTGKDEELLGRISTRLNKTRGEVINIIRKGQ
jgi:hypothetical protein